MKRVTSALAKTTEVLAREISQPGKQAPAWSDFEWRVAKAVAALHGISSLLDQRLAWQGPCHWHEFLAQQRRQTELRHHRIGHLLDQIDRSLDSARVPAVALKGAALRALGLYGSTERPMGDVDLLVRVEDAAAVEEALRALGYARSFVMQRHVVLEPVGGDGFVGFGEHIDNPVKIEVHTHIAEPLPSAVTDITHLTYPARARPGLNAYPSRAALMRHLLLHAAGNMRAHALRLIQLHDIALLAARMTQVDWRDLIAVRQSARDLWWSVPPLQLTARLYPGALPDFVLEALIPRCRWWLRRIAARKCLTDVSWSNMRIHAFPGIEWSRSPSEAARFAMSRVWPSTSALEVLKFAATTATPAAHVPWYGQSHWKRIARWVFSAPPRVQTMFAVGCALADESPEARH
jgi:hypothetical protein